MRAVFALILNLMNHLFPGDVRRNGFAAFPATPAGDFLRFVFRLFGGLISGGLGLIEGQLELSLILGEPLAGLSEYPLLEQRNLIVKSPDDGFLIIDALAQLEYQLLDIL